jgi:hypothetical protein
MLANWKIARGKVLSIASKVFSKQILLVANDLILGMVVEMIDAY